MFGRKTFRIAELENDLRQAEREIREYKRCLASYKRKERDDDKTAALKHLLTVVNEPCMFGEQDQKFENIQNAIENYTAICQRRVSC